MMSRFHKKFENPYLIAASLPFAFGLTHCVFNFYYVKVFLNIYKVSEPWFHTSQVIYMIWNAVNDPLFGYLLNNPRWKCSMSRRLPILYGGPIYAFSFLIPWFAWRTYVPGEDWLCGLHLVVSLCFYDTLFTYIGLTACCITTEMFTNYSQRIQMKWWGSVAAVLTSWSIPLCNIVSNNLENFVNFQITAVVLSIICYLTLLYAGRNIVTAYENKDSTISSTLLTTCTTGGSCAPARSLPHSKLTDEALSNKEMTCLVFKSRDFQSMVMMSFLQTFHLTYWTSFTTIMVDTFVPISSASKSFCYGITSILPALLFVFGSRLFELFGYFAIFRLQFMIKIVMSLMMYFMGPQPYIFLLFILFDSIAGESIYRLIDVILSDVADKIMRESGLSHPQSSVLVGLHALVIKPAQSLAPMLAVFLLNRAGYSELVANKLTDPVGVDQLHNNMFTLSCLLPCCIGLLQLFFWSFYTIRESKPRIIRVNSETSNDLI